MGGYYDEIEIEDMTFDPVKRVYHYPCPCGDRFEISKAQLRDYEDVATCPSCSLIIRVIFDPLDFEDYEDEEEEEDGEESSQDEEEANEDGPHSDAESKTVALGDAMRDLKLDGEACSTKGANDPAAKKVLDAGNGALMDSKSIAKASDAIHIIDAEVRLELGVARA
ncbi:Diphthamide biosynthesis protein 3 [Tulasnella sp. 330]|nr:Diphthamide biosynthesis protein 3 [Tulasnella sp. 330]KAG8875786.1 Diphthamide biosynthesis protein 3 [Tulasnella sp. 331]KAG8887052.1 Diphthamide biosynthesis protein 3 [Tulasnella sp. 332]